MSWKEFDLSNNTVADWLPWGGLTLPHVVQEKDGSYFGVIRYKALPEDCVEKAFGWNGSTFPCKKMAFISSYAGIPLSIKLATP